MRLKEMHNINITLADEAGGNVKSLGQQFGGFKI